MAEKRERCSVRTWYGEISEEEQKGERRRVRDEEMDVVISVRRDGEVIGIVHTGEWFGRVEEFAEKFCGSVEWRRRVAK
jgi:hypothetical protein